MPWNKFRKEFRNQTIGAITAAFGFLIALSWRDPISEAVNSFVEHFGLSGSVIFYKFIIAILITAVAVLFLVLIAGWKARAEEKEEKANKSRKKK